MNRLLIANRGEIARRIIRTCRRLGISPVVVFSDADTDAPHVVEADLAVRLPGRAAGETYLHVERLVAAAHATSADAVHPGYGFLSEDAGFAQAVTDAGLTWVGPPAKVIAAMASKLAAKATMAAAGVPVLPALQPPQVTEFPVLVKAAAGGGGRGMRVVLTEAQLAETVASAQHEAEAAFGDPTVFCEPLLDGARHVEVQVLADSHGTTWTFDERECSVQRRYQKIIEESPSPVMSDALRSQLTAAATDAARAVGYVGAGTIEFLLAPDGHFYFLEANTRLQVEHPITEAVYRIDLIGLQLSIADGDALPAQPPTSGGWAIEARLYAEDPTRGSQPQSGTFTRLGVPHDTTFEASELRLDSGVENGSVVPVDYDSLLAKVIAWAPTRSRATHRLAAALRMARLHGPITNRDQLVRVLEHPDFAAGRVDTGWLDRQDLSTPLADELTVRLSAVAAALARVTDQHRRTGILSGVPPGWRNVPSAPRRTGFVEADLNFEVTGRRVSVFDDRLIIAEVNAERVVLEHGGVRVCFEMGHSDGHVHVDSPLGAVRLTPLDRFPQARDEQYYPGSLMAPLPGTVSRVAVTVGEPVAAGQPLLWLEAMKMEHRIDAPTSGVVSQLPVPAGAPVKAGDILVVLTAGTDDA